MFKLASAVEIANGAQVDKSEVEAFIKKYAPLGECPGGSALSTGKRHRSGQLNDFDVCETCFEDIVKPQTGSRLAKLVHLTTVTAPNGFSCDLSFQRMRELWNSCAATDDASTFVQRVGRETASDRRSYLRSRHWRTKSGCTRLTRPYIYRAS
jgi:hypothetical protein